MNPKDVYTEELAKNFYRFAMLNITDENSRYFKEPHFQRLVEEIAIEVRGNVSYKKQYVTTAEILSINVAK